MNRIQLYILILVQICAITFLGTIQSKAQNDVNVQVKVFDLQLNPVVDAELTIDGSSTLKTNNSGIAFVQLAGSALPPKNIEVLDQKLEVESWNYSKGILEIILREKSYREVTVSLANPDNKPLAGVRVAVNSVSINSFVTNNSGKYSIKLPINIKLNQSGLFKIAGYNILQRRINDNNIIIVVSKIQNDPPEIINDQPDFAQSNSSNDLFEELDLEDLDSIASLTVLYSLMKKVNYIELDTISKSMLDDKFNELLYQNMQSTVETRNAIDLISDSTVIDQDILVVVEKIKLEELLLNNARKEFQLFTDQIATKLKEGGQNLSVEDRKQLIQLVLNLRDMLRQNEELFYRNNEFYKDEVDGLLNQLANIYELEDLLSQSKQSNTRKKEQLTYAILGFASIIGLTMLLVLLVKTLRHQKIQLSEANAEISRINTNLESIVAEKTESLELINNELDTFLYRSSHNLRRPLTSIRGLASIAEITLSSEAISLFDKVVLTTKEMEKMLDKLTMMNHINQPVNFGEINFKDITDNLTAQFEQTIAANSIIFNTTIQEDIQFRSFPVVIEIIITNLLENAFFFCKYNQERNPQVNLSFSQDSRKKLHISVHDNGCGIVPDVQEKIWEMFYIGNDLSKGNGLGLFITKKAVEALRGEIKLNTVVGTHCEFLITLPILKKSKRNIKAKKNTVSV